MKWYANLSMCYMCSFGIKDWHTRATCQCEKQGHQDSFTHANFMQHTQAGYPFCKVVVHKNIFPST